MQSLKKSIDFFLIKNKSWTFQGERNIIKETDDGQVTMRCSK